MTDEEAAGLIEAAYTEGYDDGYQDGRNAALDEDEDWEPDPTRRPTVDVPTGAYL